MDLRSLSATDLARAIAARKITSLEATEAAIARLKPVHELCNAVVAYEDDEAREFARAVDAAIAKGESVGPLAGVPLAHKDMFDRAGKIPSWGARIRLDKPCGRDATPVHRLKAAGAVQIAALHLTEFAFGPTGHNYVLGHCRNPWDPTRITGGSSSGSAVSVAAGVIPAALGSDTGGSLRLPAAACGIASIKPTWSRVSRAGAMPLSPSLDTVGALARDVRDLAAMLRVIAGFDPLDPATAHRPVPDYPALLEQEIKGLRIGVDEAWIAEAAPEVQAHLEAGLKALVKAGAKRTKARYRDAGMLDQLMQIVQLSEVASAHGPMLRARAGDYGPQVRARIEYGHFVPAADYQTAMRSRGTILAQVLAQTFADADVTILPVLADPLPTIAELDVAGGPQLQAAMGRVVKYTRPINYLGLPTLTLPAPRDGGLPCGFQLVGRPFSEVLLLALGRAYQRIVPPEVASRVA